MSTSDKVYVSMLLVIITFWIAVGLTSYSKNESLRQDLIKAKQGYYIVNPETGSTTFTNTSGIVFGNL